MELNKLLSRGVGQTQEVSGSHFLFLPADQLLWKVLRLKKKKKIWVESLIKKDIVRNSGRILDVCPVCGRRAVAATGLESW